MSTIKATLQPDPDGTVHLPLPLDLRHRMLRITAMVEPVNPGEPGEPTGQEGLRGFGCLKGKLRMAERFDDPLDDFKDYMA